MPTTRNRYIDPTATGANNGTDWANAYTSLSAAEAAEQGDITAATGSDEIVIFHCRTSGGTADTTRVTFNGWTTSSGNYVTVQAGAGYEHDGIYGNAATAYRLEVTATGNSQSAILISDEYINLLGLQIKTVPGSYQFSPAISVNVVGSSNAITIKKCILVTQSPGHVTGGCLESYDSDANITVENTVGYETGGGYVSRIYSSNPATTMVLVNCLAEGASVGINRGGGTITATNCAVFNNTNDFNGASITSTNCASDDNDNGGTGDFQIHGTYTDLFTDYANHDYSLKNYTGTGALIDAGTGTGAPTDDIIGTSRDASPDVGPFEYVAAGGGSVPVMMSNYLRMMGA